ncbi:hypothetical protein ACIQNG_35435 [Streptomyces sp. NPDC091377]|uniref:hypothetical protein n=1 Tax=Streptomyces sp. NPDC091377 TaxID=3365995 RepID=UPI003814388D
MSENKKRMGRSPRGAVLGVLGIVTLGVAALSVYVSYQILEPRFGGWAVPVVGALDALWVIFQATEILAGNNRSRAWRVQYAGLVLTAVNAAIPTADLVLTGGFDLAVVLTPLAIVATKVAWWVTLPSLGRRTSAATRNRIDGKRQQVADRLEEMEAEASDRIELLRAAAALERRVARAETGYRRTQLRIQQTMTKNLHRQAEATQKTVLKKELPDFVAAIGLPDLDTWTPTAPALPVTADRDASGPQSPVLPAGRDAGSAGATGSHAGQDGDGPGRHGDRHAHRDGGRDAVTLADLAAVAGVPTPEPGEQLTDTQLGVVLRDLRYHDDPPLSYRQAVAAFREAGFVGGEKRVRHAWGALMANEETTAPARTETAEGREDADESEDDPEDADA